MTGDRVPDHPLIISVADRIQELAAGHRRGAPAAGIVVGLSGGPDSVLLLRAAHAWARRAGGVLAAAHLNHGLRPGAADRDTSFCRDLCAALDVELFAEHADPRSEARARGCGLEEAGRHLRRRFMLRLIAENPHLELAAMGHHRDDQVETVIMRLFRGTGPDGLRGIRPVSGRFIHPLLGVSRRQIVACLEAVGQPWRTDSSNLAGDNLRARIRNELLPVVRGIFGTGSDDVPARLAELLDDDLNLLAELTSAALADVRGTPDAADLSVERLLALDRALGRRVLRQWLGRPGGQPRGLERVHIDGILAWLADGRSGSGLDLPGGLTLRRDFDALGVASGRNRGCVLRNGADFRILVTGGPAADALPEGAFGVGDPDDETSWKLVCPADALRGNLQIRNLRPGDRFQPFGLAGSKKLSDLLREWRIPAAERQGVLVVSDDEGVLWVVGLARAERTRLLPIPAPTVTISVAQRSSHPNQGNDIR
jgi:tRNA(Ile)-lysidine synthase